MSHINVMVKVGRRPEECAGTVSTDAEADQVQAAALTNLMHSGYARESIKFTRVRVDSSKKGK